jgi:aromatic ring hydroxylase
MPKLVKASVLAALNLVNSKMSRSRRILQRFSGGIFGADPSPQQTNRAAKPATMRFLKRTAAGRARRNLRGSRLHLLR